MASLADINKLTQMIKEVPDQATALTSSISSVTSEIKDLQKQASAITDGVCGEAEKNAKDIIENTILPDKGGSPGFAVSYGPNFGKIDFTNGGITDWEIIDTTTSGVVYTYTEGDYPDLDELVGDFSFGNDYLTKPMTDGATYGLLSNIDVLGKGKEILEANKAKVEDSVNVLKKYI